MVIRRRARGFTLVELLVVISIIGMLAALLMPAVQAARESGRRAVCLNNQHQLVLAVQSYEQTRHQYPGYMQTMPGSTNNANKYGTFVVPLLPFFEHNDLFNSYWNKADILMEGGSGTTILGLPNTTPYLELVVCPSDPASGTSKDPMLSYVVNSGAGGTLNTGTANSTPSQPDDTTAVTLASGATSVPRNNRNNGISFDLTGTSNPKTVVTADFVSGADGLSNTLLLSENLSADKWLIKDHSSKSAAAGEMVYNAKVGTTFQWFDNGGTIANSVDVAINGNKLTAPDPATHPKHARPSSMHNMGVNMAFADGRVKFVIDNLNYDVYIQLMTPNGVAASTTAANHTNSPLLPIGDSDY